MLTDERYKQLMNDVGLPNSRSLLQALQQCAMESALNERAVLAKSLAQQERLHKEWSELWSPIDEAVRPLTPLGESVAAKALELINLAKAMQMPKQEPALFVKFDANGEFVTARLNQKGLVFDCDARYVAYYAYPQPAQAAAMPEGYALVPLEPTKEMCDAYCEHSIAPIGNLSRYGYKAMLSASPKPE